MAACKAAFFLSYNKKGLPVMVVEKVSEYVSLQA